jgi:hypothetical protein
MPRGRPKKKAINATLKVQPALDTSEVQSASPRAPLKRKNYAYDIESDLPPVNVLDYALGNGDKADDIIEISRPPTASLTRIQKQSKKALENGLKDDFEANSVNKIADEYAVGFKENMPIEKSIEVLEVRLNRRIELAQLITFIG